MSDYSPAPGTPQTPDKAKVAAVLTGALVTILVALARYFDDKNGTDLSELLSALGVGVASGGATGVATYKTKNRLIMRR